ncbi:MAG: carbohydrate-binding protein, partial [Fibrobacter sp.]|nr:carbohydrate-binding protein [Fibrobacter sp.]
DVDYFTFVKGKDATDPEPIGGTTGITTAVGAVPMTETEAFRLFDMNGGYLGMVRAVGMQNLRESAAGLVKCGGTYLARSISGKTLQIRIAK